MAQWAVSKEVLYDGSTAEVLNNSETPGPNIHTRWRIDPENVTASVCGLRAGAITISAAACGFLFCSM